MRIFDKLALGAWAALAAVAAALSIGALSWETLEAGRFCLFQLWLGVTCPGCGMGHALLHGFSGHWAESFTHNPLVLPLLAIWTFWLGWGALNLRKGRSFSEDFPVRRLLARPLPASMALATVFGTYFLRLV